MQGNGQFWITVKKVLLFNLNVPFCTDTAAFNVPFTIGEDCSPEGIASCFKWLIPGDLDAICRYVNRYEYAKNIST